MQPDHKKYLLSAVFVTWLVTVAFYGSYAGMHSEPPTPTPRKIAEHKEAHTGDRDQQSQGNIRGADKSPLFADSLPPQESNEKSPDKHDATDNKAPNNWWSPEWSTVWVTIVLAIIGIFQLFVFGLQAFRLKQTVIKMDEIATGQSTDMKASIEAATRSADAAHRAADAAMAALDRPYLYMDDVVIKSEFTNIPNMDRNVVGFTVKNYGKAPANIVAARAAVFYSSGKSPGHIWSTPLPDSIKEFPSSDGVGLFISINGNDLAEEQPVSISTPRQDGKVRLGPAIGNGIILTEGDKTREYFFRCKHMIDNTGPALAVEYAFNLYFIGYIIYEQLFRDTEILHFCYQGRFSGDMLIFGGPDLNRREILPKPQN